jgi:hypothetical protein
MNGLQVNMLKGANSYGQPVQAGSIQGSVSAPRPLTPIRDALTRVEELVGQAHGGIDAIAERLETVLRPVAPVAETSIKDPQAPASHMENRLCALVVSLNALGSRMQDLHSRIDV